MPEQDSTFIPPSQVSKSPGRKRKLKPADIIFEEEIPLAWIKFFDKAAGFSSTPVAKWTPNHFLGYLIDWYKTYYGTPYVFSYSKPPGKSAEMHAMKQLPNVVRSLKTEELKQYIDWVLENKIKLRKFQLKKFTFFITGDFAQEFYKTQIKAATITSTTSLPEVYQTMANTFSITATTYGDLKFIQMSLTSNSPAMIPYKRFYEAIQKQGFDPRCLDEV